MVTSKFRTNRFSFPRSELENYRGLWVAFSQDGASIIASGATFEEADRQVTAAGHDPNHAVFERVPGPDDDVFLGSEEFRLCSNSPTSTSP
jgi:hypothetical protein